MRRFSVALYCPDRTIVYDGRTPDAIGVGGGVTARLSMVEALAALGHDVTAYLNCAEPLTHGGVKYVPLDQLTRIQADVLVTITTGGARTFEPLAAIPVETRLRIFWAQGVLEPARLDVVSPHYYYVVSNFVRDVAVERWGVPAAKVFVTYNGLKQPMFAAAEAAEPARDPWAMAYIGPFEKGFDSAVAVLRRLREHDSRFHLDAIGGPALWAQPVVPPAPEPGLSFRGMVGQAELIPSLFRYEYVLAPQSMEEGFGIAVQEAKRAGAIVVVSRISAYDELIDDGVDGFLVGGAHTSAPAREAMARIILDLSANPARREAIRARARQTPWDWATGARTWTAHWEHLLEAGRARPEWLALPDGLHSTTSGYFVPSSRATEAQAALPALSVLIGGYYGHGNLGDEAILAAMIADLRARRPQVSITVASGNPEDTRARHPVNAVHEREWPALLDAAAAADLVVLGGGGLLHDHFGTDDNTFLTRVHWGLTAGAAFAFLAAAHDTPFMVSGVGAGPLTTANGRRLVRLIAEVADAFTVRDDASADLLAEAGVNRDTVTVTADPAFLTPTGSWEALADTLAAAGLHQPDTPFIAVALRHWQVPGAPGHWERTLAAALDSLIDTHQVHVVFVAFQNSREDELTDDSRAAERVRLEMRHRDRTGMVGEALDAPAVQALFTRASLVIAMRLHGAILAANAGTPMVALAYDAKVRHAMARLGQEDAVLDLAQVSSAAIVALAASRLAARQEIAAAMAPRVQALRTAAHQNAVIALGLVARPRQPRALSAEWSRLLLNALLQQTRRAAVHEAGVDFLKGELEASATALAALASDREATSALLAERTKDLTLVGGALHRLRADLEWRPEHSLQRRRRNLRRRRRQLGALIARASRKPLRAAGRAYEATVPAPVRAAVRTHLARGLMSWPAYAFDRYKRARAQAYGAGLAGIRTPADPTLVSIVLPVYNGADLVREAIDSILAQTWRRLELIIVNDGSQDDTARIADSYARMDPRVRVIHQTNQKLPRALSAGFRAARGEYLTWTSADNHLAPTFIERMVSCLDRHPDWDMAYANLDIIGEDGARLIDSTFWGPDQHPPGSGHVHLPETTAELNVVANNSVGAAFMYRSRVAALIGDYSRYRFVNEDYDYWMRVNALFRVRHADFADTLYEYRVHEKSLTSRWAELDMFRHRDRLMVFEEFRRDFYLGRAVWVITGDDAELTGALKTSLARAGHLVYDGSYHLEHLPRLGLPLIAAVVTHSPGTSVAPTGLPSHALRVCITRQPDVPAEIDRAFDVAITVARESALPRLPAAGQGWLGVPDATTAFEAIDVRAKSAALEAIEAVTEGGQAEPTLRATVIICTRAADERLAQAVIAVANQSFPHDAFELIVVDNKPDVPAVRTVVDALRIQHFAAQPDRLRYVACPVPGLSPARNAGIAEARGAVVCFLDDDAVAEPDWLAHVVTAFEARPHVGLVGGHIALEIPSPRPEALQPGWEKYWSHYVTEFPELTEVTDWKQFPWGANWSARLKALREIGGFRTSYGRVGNNFFGGEELVAARLIQRLGYGVAIEPRARVTHRVAPDRFTLDHVRRTLPAGYRVGHLALRDMYLPAATSAAAAALVPLLTSHVDRTVPEGRYRWLDALYRKRAQLAVVGMAIGDLFRRARRPKG